MEKYTKIIVNFIKHEAKGYIENHIRWMSDTEHYEQDAVLEGICPECQGISLNLHFSIDWAICDYQEWEGGLESSWEYTGECNGYHLDSIEAFDDEMKIDLSQNVYEAINNFNK